MEEGENKKVKNKDEAQKSPSLRHFFGFRNYATSREVRVSRT